MRSPVLSALVAAAVVAGLALTAAGASAADAPASPQVHEGQQIFTHRCSGCHAVYDGQSSFGPNLFQETRRAHDRKNTTQIRTIIVEGKGRMPGFKEKLTDEEIKELLAYIRTL